MIIISSAEAAERSIFQRYNHRACIWQIKYSFVLRPTAVASHSQVDWCFGRAWTPSTAAGAAVVALVESIAYSLSARVNSATWHNRSVPHPSSEEITARRIFAELFLVILFSLTYYERQRKGHNAECQPCFRPVCRSHFRYHQTRPNHYLYDITPFDSASAASSQWIWRMETIQNISISLNFSRLYRITNVAFYQRNLQSCFGQRYKSSKSKCDNTD